MEIGAKVRNKSGAGPQMTVKEVTPQGYVLCTWTDPNTRQLKEGMFFAEMLQEEDAAGTEGERA